MKDRAGGDPFGLPAGYAIRARDEDDDAALVTVENRATELFRAHGYPDLADDPLPGIAEFRAMAAGHEVRVAVDARGAPVGYAVAGPRGTFLHLRELAVDPDHGRKGLGAALGRAVIEAAREAGAEGVSLTTFRTVPFNAPFYAKLGFEELALDDAPPALREAFARELPDAVEPSTRLLMVRRR